MESRVYTEENGMFKFDFTKADWATDKLHDIFHENGLIWSDADFVAEFLSSYDEKNIKLLIVEYKNARIPGASSPLSFDPFTDKKINNIVRKFTDSLCYLLSTNTVSSMKQNYYVYIVEYPHSDSTTRRLLRNKIAERLPFTFQNLPQFKMKLIEKFEVLSIDEWNAHIEYSKFPISPINT